jgi:hypothetical protein
MEGVDPDYEQRDRQRRQAELNRGRRRANGRQLALFRFLKLSRLIHNALTKALVADASGSDYLIGWEGADYEIWAMPLSLLRKPASRGAVRAWGATA